jgi:uncharacterized membrane protein
MGMLALGLVIFLGVHSTRIGEKPWNLFPRKARRALDAAG